MNILHIIFSLETGGAETMLTDIINEQVKTTSVSLIIINNRININVLNKISDKIRIYCINKQRGSKNLFNLIRLNFLIFKINPNIIHCHITKTIKYIFFKNKIKICITSHDVNYNLGDLPKYNKIFAISKSVKEDLNNRLNLKSTVVYNGINFKKILSKRIYYLNSTFRIACISRLMHTKKGQDILIKAINIIKKEYRINNVYVDFIGKGESYDYLNKLIKKYKLENNISFLGLKTRDYIYQNLRNYDLLIQPSIYEGFGLTVAEGIAAKIPVLVSNIQGPMEIINYGKHGYSFIKNDENDCAQKIIDIIKDYKNNIIEDKCNKAYLFAKKHFSIQNTAKNYLFEYKKLYSL